MLGPRAFFVRGPFFVAFPVGFFAGWVTPPPCTPGARRGRERDIFGGMQVSAVGKCVKVFLQISLYFNRGTFPVRRLPRGQDGVSTRPTFGFAAACRIRGRQLRRASAMFSPGPPLYCRWRACRCEVLYLCGWFMALGIAVGVIPGWHQYLGKHMHTLWHNTLYLHASH